LVCYLTILRTVFSICPVLQAKHRKRKDRFCS
jgi:hypothetical protein